MSPCRGLAARRWISGAPQNTHNPQKPLVHGVCPGQRRCPRSRRRIRRIPQNRRRNPYGPPPPPVTRKLHEVPDGATGNCAPILRNSAAQDGRMPAPPLTCKDVPELAILRIVRILRLTASPEPIPAIVAAELFAYRERRTACYANSGSAVPAAAPGAAAGRAAHPGRAQPGPRVDPDRTRPPGRRLRGHGPTRGRPCRTDWRDRLGNTRLVTDTDGSRGERRSKT